MKIAINRIERAATFVYHERPEYGQHPAYHVLKGTAHNLRQRIESERRIAEWHGYRPKGKK